MREVLDQSSDDEDDDSELRSNSQSLSVGQCGQSDFVILPPDILPHIESALKHPTRSQVHFLYTSYMKNVEGVTTTLHGPSLRRYLIEETGNLDCSPGSKGWDALMFAIYYITVTSLTPHECSERLGEEKVALLARFRSSTEVAMARADFVNTEDISTLQALVLYLVSHSANRLMPTIHLNTYVLAFDR